MSCRNAILMINQSNDKKGVFHTLKNVKYRVKSNRLSTIKATRKGLSRNHTYNSMSYHFKKYDTIKQTQASANKTRLQKVNE